jgi:photosystem II stability/assembly factor-like uncharacterized protein
MRLTLPALLFALATSAAGQVGAETPAGTTLAALAERTHFHGVALADEAGSRLYLASHHGLYMLSPDGRVEPISVRQDDFMGFTPHPTEPGKLYGSGHPAGGGNLGFIASADGGRSWRQLAAGVGGPVDFHQLTVSRADARVIYGAYGDLQVSRDGGLSWQRVAPAPAGLIALAASARDAGTIFAATQRGLLVSRDGGRSWQEAHSQRRPVTAVHVAADGALYAFIAGDGLLRADAEGAAWRRLGEPPNGDYILHLAAGAGDPPPLFAVTFNPQSRRQSVMQSRDGGARWTEIGGGRQ